MMHQIVESSSLLSFPMWEARARYQNQAKHLGLGGLLHSRILNTLGLMIC